MLDFRSGASRSDCQLPFLSDFLHPFPLLPNCMLFILLQMIALLFETFLFLHLLYGHIASVQFAVCAAVIRIAVV